MDHCISGKRVYASREIAEDVLIETWTRYQHNSGSGPVAVYQCEDCGYFHLTSKGPMNEKLSAAIADGKISRLKEAEHWIDKLKRR